MQRYLFNNQINLHDLSKDHANSLIDILRDELNIKIVKNEKKCIKCSEDNKEMIDQIENDISSRLSNLNKKILQTKDTTTQQIEIIKKELIILDSNCKGNCS